jgi:ATP-binding cassette, subfamily C (CFTR/MRP), member 1
MQVDCFRLSLLPKNFNSIIFISYCLIFSIVFMALLVGYAFLAGFGVLFIISVINMLISRVTGRYQKEFAKATDNRMKITNEVFNNIKFIKVNAWEEYFYDKLMARRGEEVEWLRKKMFMESVSTFSMWLAPKWILAATYGLYVLTGGELTPQKTFSIMSLYGYIQFYLQFLPNSIGITLESFNALKRIQKFMLAEEIDQSCITYDRFDLPTRDYKSNSIEIENGNFYWDKDYQEEAEEGAIPLEGSMVEIKREPELILQDVNFSIKKGELVCIVGGIGAGKSSLLYSLLGEMKFKENLGRPKVTVNGTMSLVTQKPWIVNDTVRNNITFGERFDQAKYKEVIKYACLERDFELFTHGDQTMIGEKGATLSGGQKARISFARSLYSNSDILLLDDLLSAVDVHVGKFMMTETLMKFTQGKTRILVTHALYYLKYADKVLLMEEGKIVEQGPYDSIKNCSRFKDMHAAMMKDEKEKRSTTVKALVFDPVPQYEEEGEVNKEELEDRIEAEIIREASIHTKRSKQASAIDVTKLEALRSRRSKLSKMPQIKVEEKEAKRSRQGSRKDGEIEVKVEVKKAPAPSDNELMMAEEVSVDSVLKLYASYAKYNLGFGFIAFVLIIQALWMCTNSLSNLWLVRWTDYSDGVDKTFSMEFWAIGYIILGFIYGFLAFVRSLTAASSSPKMSNYIHESMISNLLFSSLNEFFDRVPLGRIFNRLSKDLSSVDLSVTNFFGNSCVFAFFLDSNIIVISVIAPPYVFLPIIAVYLVICHFLRMFYSKPAKDLTNLEGITKSPIVSCFTEILQGVATVRCYKKESMFMQKNCHKIDENKKPIMVRKAVEVWFTFRLMLCSFIINLTTLVYVLFFLTPSFDNASKGALLLVCSLGFDEIMYFLFSNLGAFETELISIQRCETFMNLEPEIGYVQYLKNREELKLKSKERRVMKMKAEGWPDKGRLDFIDLKCRYRKNLDLVLRGINVTFTGGHKIGVVGRTGSGKSTIMLCLLRILEASDGKIMLDGRDISQLSLDDLRSKITIILQDPCLFAGTIR